MLIMIIIIILYYSILYWGRSPAERTDLELGAPRGHPGGGTSRKKGGSFFVLNIFLFIGHIRNI